MACNRKGVTRREFLWDTALASGVLTVGGIAPTLALAGQVGEPKLGATLIGKLEGPEYIPDPANWPKKFGEAPMLADLVKQGKLPPVDQRVPEEPMVIKPVHSIGRYGGGTLPNWRRTSIACARAVEGFFGAVTPVAVDVSHFERSRRVVVLPGAFPWDDVGTWSALGRVRGGDEAANVAVGPVTLRGCARTVAWSDGDPVVVDGVEGLVVVQANGPVLVTTHARAAHLKDLLDHLPPAFREIAVDADA